MIVQRNTIFAKPGYEKRVLELVKAQKPPWEITSRLYSATTGYQWQVIMEMEFKDHAERAKWWGDLEISPNVWEKFNAWIHHQEVQYLQLVE